MGINLEAPEEGPSTGRFHDCEPSDGPSFEALVASEAAQLASSPRAHTALLRYLYNPLFSVSAAAWPTQGCLWDLQILSLYSSFMSGYYWTDLVIGSCEWNLT